MLLVHVRGVVDQAGSLLDRRPSREQDADGEPAGATDDVLRLEDAHTDTGFPGGDGGRQPRRAGTDDHDMGERLAHNACAAAERPAIRPKTVQFARLLPPPT